MLNEQQINRLVETCDVNKNYIDDVVFALTEADIEATEDAVLQVVTAVRSQGITIEEAIASSLGKSTGMGEAVAGGLTVHGSEILEATFESGKDIAEIGQAMYFAGVAAGMKGERSGNPELREATDKTKTAVLTAIRGTVAQVFDPKKMLQAKLANPGMQLTGTTLDTKALSPSKPEKKR